MEPTKQNAGSPARTREESPLRRTLLKTLAAMGIGTPVLARSLVAQAESGAAVDADMIRQAEWVAGVEYTDEERDLMLQGVREAVDSYHRLRSLSIDNAIPPAVAFRPGGDPPAVASDAPAPTIPELSGPRPSRDDDLAFVGLPELAGLLHSRQVSARELAELSLRRLEEHDPALECVVNRTGERALAQAEAADRAIASGQAGPLTGIPWGAKDLLAVPGTPTTWGAEPYRDQVREETATVVRRLDEAGAVLVAKLTVGALAWGDVWFGGKTKNPWNPEQGSSGSSAGPAAATAAGLVSFALGTETWGSIVSPSTRCGLTGLRPTFGRVSRFGCMALAWSMDKIGPMARSAEDCAWVFRSIHGADGLDATARTAPFHWPGRRKLKDLRVGVRRSLFEEDRGAEIEDERQRERAREWQEIDRRALVEIESLGVELVPIELPSDVPVGDLSIILTAEATTAFDELLRTRGTDRLVRQVADAWPNVFRQGQLIPAVEYLRANRVRTMLEERMRGLFEDVDVYVSPTFGGDDLLLTNLTGHPAVVLPNGFRADGTPTSITFTANLFRDEDALTLAHAFQRATDYHRRRPPVGT